MPPPPVHVAITSLTAIVGRGVLVEIDASAAARPPFTLEITAVQGAVRSRPWFGAGRGSFLLPRRRLAGSFPLDSIEPYAGGFPHTTQIVVARMHRRGPLGSPRPNYAAFIPLAAPLSISVSVVSAEGARVTTAG